MFGVLAVAGKNTFVRLYQPNISEGELAWEKLYEHQLEDLAKTGCEVSSLCWSPHSHYFAVCGKKWEHILIAAYKSNTDVKEYRIKIPSARYQNCCAFDKSGHVLATAGVGGSVYLWIMGEDGLQWEPLTEVSNPTHATVTAISWDPTSAFLCVGDTKGHVTVHVRVDLKQFAFNDKVDLYCQRDDEISVLECNPYFPYQPSQVGVGHHSGMVCLWDIKTKTLTTAIRTHAATVTDIAYSTINGMLLASSSLDGEIHLVSLKSGTVLKKYHCVKPVYSVEFIKGRLDIVYTTDNEVITYRLKKPWTSRIVTKHEGALCARYRSSRDPIEEKNTAYFARASDVSYKDMSGLRNVVLNKPEFDPHKPSPTTKGLSREQISAQFSASSTDIAEILSHTDSTPPSDPTPTTAVQDLARNISDIAEEGSFHISDIADYTTSDEDRRYSLNISEIPSLCKRSHCGTVKENTFSPESNENEVTSPHKVRRVEEDHKENLPPNAGTPKEASASFPVSSTPAVAHFHPYKFGTPTSTHKATAYTSPMCPVKSTRNALTPNTSPDLNQSVTNLSQKLKSLGKDQVKQKQSGQYLQVHDDMSGKSSLGSVATGSIVQSLLTPNSEKICNSPATGAMVMSTEQMTILKTLITETSQKLEEKLCSETRWLKNTIVKNTLATEWELADRLVAVDQRLARLEVIFGDIQKDIRSIKNNL